MSSPDDVRRLAEFVKARRGELGLSQAEVAEAGGPSDTTQSNIELGKAAKVGAQTLAKYDAALSWTPGTAAAVMAGNPNNVIYASLLQRLNASSPREVTDETGQPDDSRESLEALIGRQPARRRGAWELGPELMVQLALATDEAEFMAATSGGHNEEDDIEDVISDLEGLIDAVDSLVKIATTVAEIGVGGRMHLEIDKQNELRRRKAARTEMRRRAAEMGRRLSPPRRTVSDEENVNLADDTDQINEANRIDVAAQKAADARAARRVGLGQRPADAPSTEAKSR